MAELRAGRSWRWFLTRLRGLASADTASATVLLRSKPASPAPFEAWLKTKAKPKEP